jgi:hypothetical protein
MADEIALMKQVLGEHPDWLETPRLRHGLILELIRRVAPLDFLAVLAAPRWRTYLALHATFSGLSDGTLRDQVQAALAQANAEHVALVARAWRQIADLFRLSAAARSSPPISRRSRPCSAPPCRLVMTALSTPEIATRQTIAGPFGAAGPEPGPCPPSGWRASPRVPRTDPAAEWSDQQPGRDPPGPGRLDDRWPRAGAAAPYGCEPLCSGLIVWFGRPMPLDRFPADHTTDQNGPPCVRSVSAGRRRAPDSRTG